MKTKISSLVCYVILFTGSIALAQAPQYPDMETIEITGIVLDQDSDEPLEYATLVLQSVQNPEKVTGGITDVDGKFNVQATPGNYNVRVEFISYKPYTLPNQDLKTDIE